MHTSTPSSFTYNYYHEPPRGKKAKPTERCGKCGEFFGYDYLVHLEKKHPDDYRREMMRIVDSRTYYHPEEVMHPTTSQ